MQTASGKPTASGRPASHAHGQSDGSCPCPRRDDRDVDRDPDVDQAGRETAAGTQRPRALEGDRADEPGREVADLRVVRWRGDEMDDRSPAESAAAMRAMDRRTAGAASDSGRAAGVEAPGAWAEASGP